MKDCFILSAQKKFDCSLFSFLFVVFLVTHDYGYPKQKRALGFSTDDACRFWIINVLCNK